MLIRNFLMDFVLYSSGAVGLPALSTIGPYLYYFYPPQTGGGGGAIGALDAIGNPVTTESWFKVTVFFSYSISVVLFLHHTLLTVPSKKMYWVVLMIMGMLRPTRRTLVTLFKVSRVTQLTSS